MKSREYRNKDNGLIYWLEGNSVMVRRGDVVQKSNMDAATFFIAIGTDRLVLVEDLLMIKWFKRLFRQGTVKFHGVRIPADFKRACPGNASGVYWEMPDGTYWFGVCTGIKSEVTQRDYEHGTWFKSMMEVGEEF